MKKKMMAIVLTGAMMTGLSACGTTANAAPAFSGTDLVKTESKNVQTETDSILSGSNDDYVWDWVDEERVGEDHYLELKQFPKYSLKEYAKGISLVSFKADEVNYTYYAMVDDQGQEVADLGIYTDESGFWYQDPYTGACHNNVWAIDGKGNFVYEAAAGQKILKMADGLILVYEEASGFDSAAARIGVVDFSGNWVYPLTSDSSFITEDRTRLSPHINLNSDISYLGDGIFAARNLGAIVDARTNLSYSYDGWKIQGDLYQDTLFLQSGHQACLVDRNLNRDPVVLNPENELKYEYRGLGQGRFLIFDRPLYQQAYIALLDFDGNVLCDLSQYADRKLYFRDYDDGGCVCFLNGADQKQYFTILDLQGRFMFDPICTDSYSKVKHTNDADHVMCDDLCTDVANGVFYFRNRSFSTKDGSMIFDFEANYGDGHISYASDGRAIFFRDDRSAHFVNAKGDYLYPLRY